MNTQENLTDTELRHYFVDLLDRIYCAKRHVLQNLPKVADYAGFEDLRYAILEACDDVEKQIKRMDEIYHLLEANYSYIKCSGINGLFEEAFQAINVEDSDSVMRDLKILFYMQNMESIEMASFKIMRIAAEKLQNPEISQLLRENFDEAKDDHALLLMINKKYLVG